MSKMQWLLKSGKVHKKNEAAVAAFNNGDQQRALQLFNESLQIYPDFDRTHQLMADLLTEMGQWQQAEAAYQKAISINPKSFDALFNYGQMLHKARRVQEAQAQYEAALAVQAGNPLVLLNLGVLCRDRGMFMEAENYFRQALDSPKLSAQQKAAYKEQYGL